MAIILIPDSDGAEQPVESFDPLREINYCHLKAGSQKGGGRFGSKKDCDMGGGLSQEDYFLAKRDRGQQAIRDREAAIERETWETKERLGQEWAAKEAAAYAQGAGHNITRRSVGDADEAVEQALLNGLTGQEIAEEIVRGIDGETFSLVVRTTGSTGDEEDDGEGYRPDISDTDDAYQEYQEEAISRVDEKFYSSQQQDWERAREDLSSKLEARYNEVNDVLAEVIDQRRAEAGQKHFEGLEIRRAAGEAELVAGVTKIIRDYQGDHGLDIDEGGPLPDEVREQIRAFALESGYGHGDEVADVPGYDADYAFEDDEYFDTSTGRRRADSFEAWRENEGAEPDYDEIMSHEDWYEHEYPKSESSRSDGEARVEIGLEGSKGTQIRRSFYKNSDGDLEVHHDYFRVGGEMPPDVGKSVLHRAYDIYVRAGIDRITVGANIDIGGYAWSRYGFLPEDGSKREVTDQFIRNRVGDVVRNKDIVYENGRRGERRSDHTFTQQEADHIISTFKNDGYDMWRLTDAVLSGGFKIGKALTLNTGWGGYFDMHDSKQVDRLLKYVHKGGGT